MFKNRLYTAIVSGHFVVDMFNGMVGVILAVLAVPLALSNFQIGLIVTLYALAGSLSQPLFGWLADQLPDEQGRTLRLTPLLLSGVGVLWMALSYLGVAFLATSWIVLLIFLLLSALGSGLFHPIGTSRAVTSHPGSPNQATAMFFLVGQMGFAVGPVAAGVLLAQFDMLGILPLIALGTLPGLMLFWTMHDPQPSKLRMQTSTGESQHWRSIVGGLMTLTVLAFVVLVALRSSIHATYQFMLPAMFAEKGWKPEIYGLIVGLVIAAAAVGNVVIGNLVDRLSLRTVVVGSLLLSVPLGLLFVFSNSLPVVFVSATLAGLMIGGSHSVIVVHAQRLLPVRQGFAAGLILGFIFGAGALGTWLCGYLGDIIGMQMAVVVIVLFALPAALLALTLPGRDLTVEQPEVGDVREPEGERVLAPGVQPTR